MQAIKSILLISTLLCTISATCDFSGYISSSIGTQICAATNSFTLNGVTYAGYEYDAVSFNELTITHGDIQGRVAARNNFRGVDGSSVGDQIIDGNGLYTLIAGGDISLDGEAFPLAQSIFVGGSAVDVPASVSARVSGTCTSAGCAGAAFDNVLAYWNAFSQQLSAGVDNVDLTFENGVVTISCQSSTSSVNFVNLDFSEFNQIIGYTVSSNCASTASFVFNILGSGDVSFDGNPIVSSGYIVYNIVGARSVNIVSSVNGNIVAPSATFNQVGGTVYGQVVAGNFLNVIQINRPSCPFGDAQAGSNFNSASACPTLSGSTSDSTTDSTTAESVPVPESTTDSTTDSTTNSPIGEGEGDVDAAQGNSASIAAPLISLVIIALLAL